MQSDHADQRSRQEIWDERHSAHAAIESRGPDPTLVEELHGLEPGLALDLATGDGRNAIWLAAHGWRVTAVDFSTVALERARHSAAEASVEVEWRMEDLLRWRPPEALFDLVTVMFLHLPPGERLDVYGRAASAVRPGGTLLVVGHDRANLTGGSGGPQNPDVLFTPQEIVAGLPEFEIARADTVRRGGGESGPLDAVVRAVRRSHA